MLRRKRTTGLTDYRSLLNTTGDISVGAYAAHQRRRQLLVALLGVALIGGAAWVYSALRPGDQAAAGGTYPVAVECVACGYRGVVQMVSGKASFPVVCPKCKGRSCYELWQCREPDCGAQFWRKGGVTDLRCERCGSRRVGAAEEPAPRPDGG